MGTKIVCRLCGASWILYPWMPLDAYCTKGVTCLRQKKGVLLDGPVLCCGGCRDLGRKTATLANDSEKWLKTPRPPAASRRTVQELLLTNPTPTASVGPSGYSHVVPVDGKRTATTSAQRPSAPSGGDAVPCLKKK